MGDKPDWEAIQREYETGGITLRPLALKYGVSKTSLIERRNKEGWTRPTDRPTTNDRPVGSITVLRNELPSIPSAVDGANFGIEALVEILKENKTNGKKMDLSEHVKAATALYQYNRIIVNAIPVEDDEEEDTELITVDTRDLDADRLAKLKAFALEMKESKQIG